MFDSSIVFGVLLQLFKWGILSVENNKTSFDEKKKL